MGSEDQALTIHSKKSRTNYHRGKHSHQKDNSQRSTRDLSKFRCYTCDEKGHFARYCPRNKGGSHKKKEKIKHHAHTAEDDDPPRKRVKQESEYFSSDEEYVLISSITRTVTNGRNDWIIDSGASKHMTGFKESFVKLSEHE